MGRKYFGTDGIRGEANIELTPELAMDLGFAFGYYLKNNTLKAKDENIKVIIGQDTRVSGDMLRSALTAGLTSMGIDVDYVDVIPTPGVSYLTRHLQAEAGIMISASHNPAKDNGIKIFNKDGFKLPDNIEEEIENLMDGVVALKKERVKGDQVGRFRYSDDDYFIYQEFLRSTIKNNFKGMKIILDAANGAAYKIAAKVFSELEAEIVTINNIPNGVNINVKCGSTDLKILSKVVVGYEADLGLAFDGDADRLLAVDKFGNVIDGDKIIAIVAQNMKKEGKLNKNKVVTTVMSNMGFENYLTESGIELVRANVGDRYVLEKMKEDGLNLGGEQSGHIIFLDYNTTGDGILTALQLVSILKREGKTVDELIKDIVDYPQVLINVKVSNDKKKTWKDNERIQKVIKEKEDEMQKMGRVLIRPSGTEPMIRVMTEGKYRDQVEAVANEIANVLREELV